MQIGLPEYPFLRGSRISTRLTVDLEEPAQVLADPHWLPFAENGVDLIVLPHVLEFTDEPHQLLREVHRVIRPEGHLIIAGFNPFSLFGAKRYFGREQTMPWTGNFVALYRLKDWLSLLGFEVVGGRLDCYVPPFQQEKWLHRFDFFEKAGDRWWPIAGRRVLPARHQAHSGNAGHHAGVVAPRAQEGAGPRRAPGTRVRGHPRVSGAA